MDTPIIEFVESLKRRKTTKETYLKALREFFRWLKGASPEALNTGDIQEYREYLVSKELSPASLSTYLTAVRRFYDFLMEKSRVEQNPAKRVRGSSRPQRHLKDPLFPAEIKALLGVIDASDALELRDWAIINLMLRCGLSEIEIIRADVGDIKVKGGKQVLFVQGKSKDRKDEYVILTPPAQEALMKYLHSRGEVAQEEPLFPGIGNRAKGGRISTRAIRERVSYYLKAAGIKRKGITPYSLRHTAALLAIQNGAPLSEVKRMLRHKTVESTLVYFEEAERLRQSGEDYIKI